MGSDRCAPIVKPWGFWPKAWQLLHGLRQVRVLLGAVVHQEQAQSAALASVVAEARTAVSQSDVVNSDESGWPQEKARAWLWTVVLAELTVFRSDRPERVPTSDWSWR